MYQPGFWWKKLTKHSTHNAACIGEKSMARIKQYLSVLYMSKIASANDIVCDFTGSAFFPLFHVDCLT